MENVILEIRENEETLGKTDSTIIPPSWLNLRLTLDTEISDQSSNYSHFYKKSVMYLLEVVEPYVFQHRITCGLEFKNELGEFTYPHCHIAFQTLGDKGNIRRQLQRWYKKTFQEPLVGNKMYALSFCTNIDEERFFRYPLKQYDQLCPKIHKANPSFSLIELERMRAIANASWKIGREVANKKKANREPNDTLFARITHSLDKLKELDRQVVTLAILEFYIKENRAINNTTIVGYSRLYLLKKGLIDKSDYARSLASQI